MVPGFLIEKKMKKLGNELKIVRDAWCMCEVLLKDENGSMYNLNKSKINNELIKITPDIPSVEEEAAQGGKEKTCL